MPASREGGQRLLSASLLLDPPANPRVLTDVFGNTLHHVDFLEPVDLLHVSVGAQVETSGAPEPAAGASPLLDRLYRQSTARAPFEAGYGPLVDEAAGKTPGAAALSLMHAVHQRFRYELGASLVTHTAVDLVESGAGVCQDFAHLMLAVLRMRGHAARYVSGYLAPPAGEALATASHAWVQVLDGGAWHGFDPANGVLADERYVVTAVGRDYDDVPPLRGTYTGVAEEQWSTSVRVAADAQ